MSFCLLISYKLFGQNGLFLVLVLCLGGPKAKFWCLYLPPPANLGSSFRWTRLAVKSDFPQNGPSQWASFCVVVIISASKCIIWAIKHHSLLEKKYILILLMLEYFVVNFKLLKIQKILLVLYLSLENIHEIKAQKASRFFSPNLHNMFLPHPTNVK